MTVDELNQQIAWTTPLGGTVMVPPDMVWDKQVYLQRGVRLAMPSVPTYDYHKPGLIKGAVHIVWGDGPGASSDPNRAAIKAEAGTIVDGMGFDYPNQNMLSPTPIEYGATIHCYDPGINQYGCAITNNDFGNAYHAVQARQIPGVIQGLSNFVMTGNQGFPIKTALSIDGVTDWQTVAHNRWNVGFDDPGLKSGLPAWCAANGISLDLGGNDWFQTIDWQVFGYHEAVRITAGVGYTGGGPYTFDACQMDGCYRGINLIGAIGHPTTINNCRFAPYQWIDWESPDPAVRAAAMGCSVAAVNAAVNGIVMIGTYTFGPAEYALWANAASDVQLIGNRAVSSGSGGAAFGAMTCKGVQAAFNRSTGFASGTIDVEGSTGVQLGPNQ